MDEEDHARQSESNVDVTLCHSAVFQSTHTPSTGQEQLVALRQKDNTGLDEARQKTSVALFNAGTSLFVSRKRSAQ